MEISMTEQGIVFLFSCVVGAFLGGFYDVFRILRIAFKPKWITVFVQDIIFCVISAFVIIFSIYYTNSGRVRLFGLTGCFLCFVLYHMTVGKFIMFVSKRIIDFIKRMLNFLYSITINPLKIAVLFIIRMLKKQIKFILKLLKNIKLHINYSGERKKIANAAGRGFNLYDGSKISRENMKLINSMKKAEKGEKNTKTMLKSKRGNINVGKIKVQSEEKKQTKNKGEKQKSILW